MYLLKRSTRKAIALDDRIIELRREIEANKTNLEDLAEIDRVLENIDAEVAKYINENNQLKVEYILEHLKEVQIYPDKVIVIVPILSEGIVVEKTQYVSREKRRRQNHHHPHHYAGVFTRQRQGAFGRTALAHGPRKNRLSAGGTRTVPEKPILEQLLYFGKLGGLSKKQAAEQADRLLKRLGMAEYRDKRLDTLSKGNQQKIQLVATLITDPDIVILDEPFSGLDPVNAKLLKELVQEMIANGKLVLFSSHQMNYIEEFCNDIVILRDGKAVLSGDIGEIKRGFDRRTVEIVTTDSAAVAAFLQEHKTDAVQRAECSENLVTVTLARAEDKAALYALLADCADKIDAFRVKEPTLNEIFVHYTEGSI